MLGSSEKLLFMKCWTIGKEGNHATNMVPSSALHSLIIGLQVHYDTWRHPADVQARQSGSHASSLASRLLPQSLQDAYSDGVARLPQPANGQVSGFQETKKYRKISIFFLQVQTSFFKVFDLYTQQQSCPLTCLM